MASFGQGNRKTIGSNDSMIRRSNDPMIRRSNRPTIECLRNLHERARQNGGVEAAHRIDRASKKKTFGTSLYTSMSCCYAWSSMPVKLSMIQCF
jgi:hypothetical protein